MIDEMNLMRYIRIIDNLILILVERRGEVIVDVDSLDEPFNFDVKKSKFDKNELLLIVLCCC